MRYIKENRYDIFFLIGILLFILCSYLIVPFVHELGHVLALKYFGCNYWAHFEYGFFKSFFGEVYEKCMLTPRQLAIVYIAGVTLTFSVGLIFLILEYMLHKKHHIEGGMVLLFVAYAFILDLVNYLFFKEGDIIEFMKIIGLSHKIKYLPLIGIFFVILLLTYLYIELNREIDVVIEEEEHIFKRLWKKFRKRKKD